MTTMRITNGIGEGKMLNIKILFAIKLNANFSTLKLCLLVNFLTSKANKKLKKNF